MTGPAHILLVEDERTLADGIRENLEAEGYRVEHVADGASGHTRILAEEHDLVLLDVMLPEMDGFEVCRRAREQNVRTPILFLTARGQLDDRVRGLELGGDDYLPKPFHLQELLVRVAAMLRRRSWQEAPSPAGDRLTIGAGAFDFRTFQGRTWDGRECLLTHKEAMILKCLAERAGEVVSREDILDRVWGYDVYPSTRTIDNFIVRLRKRFERGPRDTPVHFHTVRGVGYRFDARTRRSPPSERPLPPATLRGGESTPNAARVWIMRQAGRYPARVPRAPQGTHSFEERLRERPSSPREVTIHADASATRYDAAIVFADLMTPVSRARHRRATSTPGPVLSTPRCAARADRSARLQRCPHGPRRSRRRSPRRCASCARSCLDESREPRSVSPARPSRSLAAYLVQGKGEPRTFALLRALALRAIPSRLRATDRHVLAQTSVAAYLIEQHKAGAARGAGLRVVVRHSSRSRRLAATTCKSARRAPPARGARSARCARRVMFLRTAAPQHGGRTGAQLPSRRAGASDWRCDLPARARAPRRCRARCCRATWTPRSLLAGPERRAAPRREALLESDARRVGHIVNLGHGIQPETPMESVQAVIDDGARRRGLR